MKVCDLDTCGAVDCLDAVSIGSIVSSSSEDFIANLLHLKCKVIRLARTQMQKEIPGLRVPMMNQGYVKSAGGEGGPTRVLQVPVENIVESPDDRNEARKMEKRKNERSTPTPVIEQSNDSTNVSSEIPRYSVVHWLKSIFTSNLPFYWIILVIGLLGFTSLVCGVLLGAFICTNGSNSAPFFFWAKSRVGHAVY